jgi:hypothetical protein
MITADLSFEGLAPTATQWVDEVQMTVSSGGFRRVGISKVPQFTPPFVEMKASPALPIETQKFSAHETAAPTGRDPRVHVPPPSEVTIGDPLPLPLGELFRIRPTQC